MVEQNWISLIQGEALVWLRQEDTNQIKQHKVAGIKSLCTYETLPGANQYFPRYCNLLTDVLK
jgi:hypothetical protein